MPFVSRDGVRLYYETEGEGPAVLLHTGDGGDLRIWRMAGYPAGLAGFRCILMDQRGRGRSDRPGDAESYRMERLAEDVAAVLDDVGETRAGFWGYSSGIYAGVAFGAMYPARLKALVGTGVLRPRDLTELPPLDVPAFIAQDVAGGGVIADLEEYWKVENDRFPDAIDANVRAGDPRAHALSIVGRRSWAGPRSALGRFDAPILILSGEKEDTEQAGEATAKMVPRVELVRLGGVGHLGAFYRSDLALPHALPFLRRHGR